jgi:hypothetical protein
MLLGEKGSGAAAEFQGATTDTAHARQLDASGTAVAMMSDWRLPVGWSGLPLFIADLLAYEAELLQYNQCFDTPREAGSCYRWLARSVCPRLSSGRSLGSGARRLLAAARRLGATTSSTAYTNGAMTGWHEECQCSYWCGRCFGN